MKISALRLARLQKQLSLDEVFFATAGRVTPPRLSRIERGLAKPTAAEVGALVQLLDVPPEVVNSVPTPPVRREEVAGALAHTGA